MSSKLRFVVPLVVLLLTGCGAAEKAKSSAEGILGTFPDSFQLGAHLGSGENAFEAGNYKGAESEFKKALASAEKTKELVDLGECYTRLGQTYKRLKRPDEAMAQFAKANEVYEEAEEVILFKMDMRVWAQGLKEYGELLKADGQKEKASEVIAKWAELRKELGAVEDIREKMTQF